MRTTSCAIALVVASAAVALTGCTANDATTPAPTSTSPGPTGVAARPESSRYLAILNRPATADDVLPDSAVDAPDDLVPNSQRRAVAQDGTTYWVGASENGGACLLSWNADPDSTDNWGMCGGTDVRPESIVVSMSGDDGRVVALASDGFPGGEDLHAIAPNVWVS